LTNLNRGGYKDYEFDNDEIGNLFLVGADIVSITQSANTALGIHTQSDSLRFFPRAHNF